MKYAIFLTLVVIATSYLIGSFVAWDFNPKSWGPEGRILLGIVTGFTVIISVKEFLQEEADPI
jgi:hypothetical protein